MLLIKDIFLKPNIILSGKILKVSSPYPLGLGIRCLKCPPPPLPFGIVLVLIASGARHEKEIKVIRIGKEGKLSLLTDHMII